MTTNTFYYFAYGSNLLSQRIHINNPTAVRHGIGKLEDFRLDFATYTDKWKGAVATIVPMKGHAVWGAIWKIGVVNKDDLDRQEGVEQNFYFAVDADVRTSEECWLKCRVYQQTEEPEFVGDIENLPNERLPSAPYLKTVILGAMESKLPKEYIDFLHRIRHNGYTGDVDVVGLKLDDVLL